MLKTKNRPWTREETIVALALYYQLPFSSVNKFHPEVILHSQIIQRSPSSLGMKIGNLGSLDIKLKKDGIVGLGNSSVLDRTIWNEFSNNLDQLAYESKMIIAKLSGNPIESLEDIFPTEFPLGHEREALIKQRINQKFFRNTVLAAYNSTCCITGIKHPALLVASHIVPWAKNPNERLNPQNGLCLNALHDKAFDKGLISIAPDYTIQVSSQLLKLNSPTDDMLWNSLLNIDGTQIMLPERHKPARHLLEYHFNQIFIK